ncbi:MAG: hypothetical protein II743_01345 [Lachnospiraceae bacterium]|nr:hypothetical protein [Lachnospiraceae bacterium]
MMTIRIVAALGMIAGLFFVFGVTLRDFSEGLFGRISRGSGSLRDEILEETKRKKKSALRRELEEVGEILKDTGRSGMLPFLCTVSLLLFGAGAVVAATFGNYFLIPVLAAGFSLLPFWYVRLTAGHFRKLLDAELETSLSVITTAYLRCEDLITSVSENAGYLNPPVRTVFEKFLHRVRFVDPDVFAALDEMKGSVKNAVFEEWVDAMKACQYDRSLKSVLVPIVTKLSDARIVNSELEMMLSDPRKEFITMAVLVVSNVPLMYFLNRDWYHALTQTVVGQVMMAICGAVIFVSAACVIRLTKPMDYQA